MDVREQAAEISFDAVQEADSAPKKQIIVKRKPVYEFVKRLFDIMLSALAGIVLLVPILVFAILIMIKDPGNPFYIHTRIGKDHKSIKILKLRRSKWKSISASTRFGTTRG